MNSIHSIQASEQRSLAKRRHGHRFCAALGSYNQTSSAGANSGFVPVRHVRTFLSALANAAGPIGKMDYFNGVELKKRTLAQIYDREARLRCLTWRGLTLERPITSSDVQFDKEAFGYRHLFEELR